MKNIHKLLFIIIFVSLFSCQKSLKFNESQWKTANDIDYNHREFMIEDLSKNYLKTGMEYNEVVRLLGQNEYPKLQDSVQLEYEIYTDYGIDIDPVETKTLVLNFNSDSIFKNYHIENWKK